LPWFHEQMKAKHFVKGKSHGNQVYRGVKFRKMPDDTEILAEKLGFK